MEAILGLGIALPVASSVGIGTVTGVAQGVKAQREANKDANNAKRMLKFHLDVEVEPSARKHGRRAEEVAGGIVVVRNDKVAHHISSHARGYYKPHPPPKKNKKKQGSPKSQETPNKASTSFYLAYPDDARPTTRGLVSTISLDPPMLNWIYIDKSSHQVKYANRSGSIAHHVGDFDWTDEEDDSRVTFDGWEGFLAVEEEGEGRRGVGAGGERGVWALYFDVDDDGLAGRKKGRRTLEVGLRRRLVTAQEVNKWGMEQDGNMGFRATREV
ncbi:hypothetical protein LTR66_012361 [Elasticomyces elasticus]|nr:hypothetical protein LTR66_012361 [Elasticomyces elasticus]